MSTVANTSDSGRRYAAWAAILGGLFILTTVVFIVLATAGDLQAMSRPATALGLTPQAQQWFLLAMVFDVFGFYLPFLLIGPYLAARLRPRFGSPIDMATFSLGCYVLLGLAGAAIQIATLPPLAQMHAAGDAMARAASESAWLTVVTAAQSGLWWMEGPLMAFWGIVTGRALLASGARLGALLIGIGVLYGAFFVGGLLGALDAALIIELIMIFALAAWTLLTGITLLRQPEPAGAAD